MQKHGERTQEPQHNQNASAMYDSTKDFNSVKLQSYVAACPPDQIYKYMKIC